MKTVGFLLRWIVGFLLFIVGLFFLILGVMGFVFIGIVATANDGRAEQILGQVWFQHDPFFWVQQTFSIQLVQVVIERKLLLPWLWNPGITTILNWPSWVALLVVGAVGVLIGWFVIRFAARLPRRS
ncbi:MAG: hypothetical protein H6873_03880 [Hyphomicrobiaceae bacterium]|nr:hypothetical protein [Hyphomicrobiaceae bacterium]